MKVVVVLPTRGLVFTEVLEAIERERSWCDIAVLYSTDLPIPQGHNELTEKALKLEPDYIWYIEEDTVPPILALSALVGKDADVAFIDYAVNGWGCAAEFEDGEIVWCGLGCTLVKASVLKDLPRPLFRTDKSLSLNEDTYFKWLDLSNKYGGQDIWFFSQIRKAGFQLCRVDGECRHLKIEGLGTPGKNNGFHTLAVKSRIANKSVYKRPLTINKKMINNESIGINPQL